MTSSNECTPDGHSPPHYNYKLFVVLSVCMYVCVFAVVGCYYSYCDCFANGEFCRKTCYCQNCKNSIKFEDERAFAIKVHTSQQINIVLLNSFRHAWTEIP